MRALFASPLGLLVGLSLGALGGGGSILAVPALVYGAGQSPSAATGTSLVVVGIAALMGMGAHWRAGHVDVRGGLMFSATGAIANVGGSWLNGWLDGDFLLLGFSVMVLFAAWQMGTQTMTETTLSASGGAEAAVATIAPARPRVLVLLVVGSGVGFLTGLFGVGGGFVIVPALMLVLGYSMARATGTSLLVIALSSAVALAGRGGPASLDLGVTVPFVIAAVSGALFGKRLADRMSGPTATRVFVALLVVVALYSGIDAMTRITIS